MTRRAGQPYKFLDAAESYRDKPATEYGLLMSTSSSRILFPKPTINPDELRVLRTAAPAVADFEWCSSATDNTLPAMG